MPNFEQPKPIMTPEELKNLDLFLAERKEQEQEIEIQEQPEKAEEGFSKEELQKTETQTQERPEIQKTEKPQESQKKEVSFFRNQKNKTGLVLLSLGITIAGWGCEKNKDKNFDEIKKRAGQFTELLSKTEQENGYITTVWEDPNTQKRLQISGYYKSDDDHSYSYLEMPSEEEQKAKAKQRLTEEQKLADEQQLQEQEKQKIKEKAKEHLDEARELMYPYEYEVEEMSILMSDAKEIYEFAGEATPKEIKEFLQGEQWSKKDIVDLAQQIDEKTVLDIAEQIVKNPQRNYQGWENYQQVPNIEKKLENIIQYTLPKGWGNYNVARIIFDVNYPGIAGGKFNPETNELFIYPYITLEEKFFHEFFHAAGDAEYSDNMPLGMRIQLEKILIFSVKNITSFTI